MIWDGGEAGADSMIGAGLVTGRGATVCRGNANATGDIATSNCKTRRAPKKFGRGDDRIFINDDQPEIFSATVNQKVDIAQLGPVNLSLVHRNG